MYLSTGLLIHLPLRPPPPPSLLFSNSFPTSSEDLEIESHSDSPSLLRGPVHDLDRTHVGCQASSFLLLCAHAALNLTLSPHDQSEPLMTSSHKPGLIERWFRHERDDVGDLWRSWNRRKRWLAVRVCSSTPLFLCSPYLHRVKKLTTREAGVDDLCRWTRVGSDGVALGTVVPPRQGARLPSLCHQTV